jgi:hypothetical protein
VDYENEEEADGEKEALDEILKPFYRENAKELFFPIEMFDEEIPNDIPP